MSQSASDPTERDKNEVLKQTVIWLKENYEHGEGVSIPRQIIYDGYTQYCLANQKQPVSPATFGKVIRQQFPIVATRRLGTRGHSKYHYHGLAMRPGCPSFDVLYSKRPNKTSDLKLTLTGCHPKNRMNVIPKVNLTVLPDEDSEDCVKTRHFLIMYETHSNQMLESIFHGDFEEATRFVDSLWSRSPQHFSHLLVRAAVVLRVVSLDAQVYWTLLRQMLPAMGANLPLKYLNSLVGFLYDLPELLKQKISRSYEELSRHKILFALMFKHACLCWLRANRLYQTSFPDIVSSDTVSHILCDLEKVDVDAVAMETIQFVRSDAASLLYEHLITNFESLENLIEENFVASHILEWVENVNCRFKHLDILINGQTASRENIECCVVWTRFFCGLQKILILEQLSSYSSISVLFTWILDLMYVENVAINLHDYCGTRNHKRNRYSISRIESLLSPTDWLFCDDRNPTAITDTIQPSIFRDPDDEVVSSEGNNSLLSYLNLVSDFQHGIQHPFYADFNQAFPPQVPF